MNVLCRYDVISFYLMKRSPHPTPRPFSMIRTHQVFYKVHPWPFTELNIHISVTLEVKLLLLEKETTKSKQHYLAINTFLYLPLFFNVQICILFKHRSLIFIVAFICGQQVTKTVATKLHNKASGTTIVSV